MVRNKTVLITGASSGIGNACAEKFAEAGANLVLIARRFEKLLPLAISLKDNYKIEVHCDKVDVREPEDVKDMLLKLPEGLAAIDILINNAGLAAGFGSVSEGSNEDWDDMIETNIKGLLNVTRTIIPGFIERKKGHIINIGSIAGRQVYPKGTVYCATKFAVRAITQGLLMELYDTPIRVSTIDPGLVETEFSLVRFKGDEDQAKQVYTGITPLTSGDVADAVVFCASRPPHVNISEMVLLPTDQASPYHVNRQ